MPKMTVGEYLGYLSDRLTLNPDLSNEPLYSEEGILFGWEDSFDVARKLDTTEYQVRVWINEDILEGVKSNDHVILPPGCKKPEVEKFEIFFDEKEEENNGEEN